ncbi:MAG: low temperature requirement protein A [Phycicoccus sp.]|nr:low temperature requirement protein A [Phycicoccus sp.]
MRRFAAAPSAVWSDLYYDLALVAAIVVLSGSWALDHSLGFTLWLGLVFGLIWSTWVVTSLVMGTFSGRDAAPGAVDIALLTVQMATILLVTLSSVADSSAADNVFGILLGMALGTGVILGWRARRRGTRVQTNTLVLMASAATLIVVSEILPDALSGWANTVWWVALVGILVAAAIGLQDSAIDPDRLSHRFGELTIILIGETLLKMALSADEKGFDTLDSGGLALVVVFVTAIWWDYFSDAVRRPPGSPRRRSAWGLSHFLLHLALIGAAVGLGKLAVADSGLGHGGTGWLIGAPLTLAMLALTMLDIFGERSIAPLRAGVHAGATLLLAGLTAFALSRPDDAPLPIATWMVVVVVLSSGLVSAISVRPGAQAAQVQTPDHAA